MYLVMKHLKNLLAIICLAFFSISVTAEKPKYQKESFQVWGNCGMCKTTIEKAAKSVDGVKSAVWDKAKAEVTVKFNPELTNIDAIQTAIALVGYDTELHKATDESYNNLHFCCKYERPIEKK